MSNTIQVMKIGDHSAFTLDEQQRFWRKLHYYLGQTQSAWNQTQKAVWIDVVYKGNEPFEVYLALPQPVLSKIPSFLCGKGRRKRTGKITLSPASQEHLRVFSGVSVCELRLAQTDLLSLSTANPLQLPSALPLGPEETARISCYLFPASSVESGLVRTRKLKPVYEKENGHVTSRNQHPEFFYLVLLFINKLITKLFGKEKASLKPMPPLTQDTIRKLNDRLFKAYIRIAAPQFLLPKLSVPFQLLKGENELTLQFLSKADQKACLQAMNRQKVGMYNKGYRNPNLLGCREISRLFPVFSAREVEPESIKEKVSPKFL